MGDTYTSPNFIIIAPNTKPYFYYIGTVLRTPIDEDSDSTVRVPCPEVGLWGFDSEGVAETSAAPGTGVGGTLLWSPYNEDPTF